MRPTYCFFLNLAFSVHGQLPAVVDIIKALPELSSFRETLEETDLLTALEGGGPFTVFAPSSTAIELLGPGVLATLRSGQNEQKYLDLLRYHVVYAELRSSDMHPGLTLMTWNSLTVEITDVAPVVRLNGQASVSQADIACSNGWVHVVSRVATAAAYVFPPPMKNIFQLAQSTSYLANIAVGATLSGLESDYSDERSEFALTVFLPTDTAFTKMGLGVASSLQLKANEARLLQLLKYHTVRGVYPSSELSFGQTLKSLEGTLVTVTSLVPTMLVNEKAMVISADVPATNGMIQLMDTVLLPTTWAYPDKTILQIIQASPDLSILRTALQKTDMAWIFASASKQTLLAPTDEAFLSLGRGVAASLLLMSNLEDLVALVQLHILEGAKTSMDMVAGTNIVSRQGEAVTVNTLQPLTFNGAVSRVQDVPTTNGVLHIMDQVVLPKVWRFPERNFMQFANKESDLSEFVRLVSFSGLVEEFQGNGPFTAMIPTNYAFSKLGSGMEKLFLPENAQKLKALLRYHVVLGKFLSIHLTSPKSLGTLQGEELSAVPWTQLGWTGIAYQSASPPVVINSKAQVLTPDVLATNGVVHIIDHVLFPPGVDLSFFDTTQPPFLATAAAARTHANVWMLLTFCMLLLWQISLDSKAFRAHLVL